MPLANMSALPPQDAEEAQRAIIWELRARCPNGFQSREASDKIAKLTPTRRRRALGWATEFPEALHIADMDGRTPLAWLSRYDEPALIKAFLDLGAHPRGSMPSSPRGVHPLAQACELRHGASLAILARAAGVEDIVYPEASGRSADEHPLSGARALFAAAMNTNDRGIDTLIELGADPLGLTANGDTAMHALAFYKKTPQRAGPCAAKLAAAAPELLSIRNHAGLTPRELAEKEQSPMAAFFLAMEERTALNEEAPPSAKAIIKPRI